MSTVVITPEINSSIGLALLLAVLLLRNGMSGLTEAIGAVRPWAVLPGLLGSFFMFAGIMGYQRIGAATIATLVASQLVAGLLADASKSDASTLQDNALPFLGARLLVLGLF